MVKIMVTGYYDPAGYENFLPVFMSPDKPKYPDYIKKVENLATGTGDFKIYAIYEVPDDKIYESIKHLNKRYSFYAAKMDGYTYDVELVGPMEDAIASLK
jgi:hypothetical protein